ncbi:hypothetical protein EYC84_001494 [Monilinia fructicola]|uniref:S1 motif domain-containing protein n=1 Tax=Monilinia fructicola TaxID=38448 RepID=A0A5M9JPS6_MONFR|nr:hypothetical protein EYC84_001494 [Monilinia fructicola]
MILVARTKRLQKVVQGYPFDFLPAFNNNLLQQFTAISSPAAALIPQALKLTSAIIKKARQKNTAIMSMRDLIDGDVEVDEEEQDEEFDEETEDDSSEEEDDDDEEAARAIREGFIVDEDEEDDDDARSRRRRREKKRRREQREEEGLDDEDLDLIGEANPEWERKTTQQPKFKRLKRGHRDDNEQDRERGLDQIFSDDEEQDAPLDYDRSFARPDHRVDEFADFIEEDELEDDERDRLAEEREVARPREKGYVGGGAETSGLDKDALDDMEAIFGNGEDYDWALALEDEAEAAEAGDQNLELKDVFEPSQLAEKLLTDEDNVIRYSDEPERFQLDRKPYKHLQITDEQFREEARWITSLIWPKKTFSSEMQAPFTKAISKVLEFFVVDEVEVPYVFQHRKDYLIHARKNKTRSDPNNPDAPDYEVSADKLLNQDDLWRILELDLKFRALIEKRNVLEKTYDNLKLAAGVNDATFEKMIPDAQTMEELQDIQDYLYFQYSSEIKSLQDANGESRAYQLVRAYGITADEVAQNVLMEGRKKYTEDPSLSPIDLADTLTSPEDFTTGENVLNAARAMFAEELFMSPKMRQHFRKHHYMAGLVSCARTDKGLKKIDEQHPFYELKYLKNQTFGDIASKPEMFLKMLKAEEEGLLEVKVSLQNEREFKRQLYAECRSDNFSEVADAWNDERQKVLDLAFSKLERTITKGVKESMRTECQDSILKICREEYSRKLDQAPYKPRGMVLGTIPRVLALSNGNGDPTRDACRNIPSEGNEFEDESGEERSEPLDIIIVNDEVARLYKDSPRAAVDHPAFAPLVRYCVGLAKYLQNPMKEYAALGKDIISLSFHPCQQLLPEDKLRRQLETAMVDMVNLLWCQYQRSAVLKSINANGGVVNTRDELVGDPDNNKLPVVGPRVWNNCASFLYIEYESANPASDYLDNTRVHPEDYELGRKMAADALELDEEDVKAEVDEGGAGAIVRKLIKDDEQEKVNDLILEEYADQLERNYNQRKRATLETIRAELLQPYEELRRNFGMLSDDEIFTMLTGETHDSLCEGMIVSVNIRVAKDDFIIAKLDSGIEGRVEKDDGSDNPGASLNHYHYASLKMRPYRKRIDREPGNWDSLQEQKDREELREKDKATGRVQRVVKHLSSGHSMPPKPKSISDHKHLVTLSFVLLPKEMINLAVTWKVADGVYQHLDVLELQKENEFSVGRQLRIGNKYNYSDLDELIVDHVKAMSKKVEEMMLHEKFQKGQQS